MAEINAASSGSLCEKPLLLTELLITIVTGRLERQPHAWLQSLLSMVLLISLCICALCYENQGRRKRTREDITWENFRAVYNARTSSVIFVCVCVNTLTCLCVFWYTCIHMYMCYVGGSHMHVWARM